MGWAEAGAVSHGLCPERRWLGWEDVLWERTLLSPLLHVLHLQGQGTWRLLGRGCRSQSIPVSLADAEPFLLQILPRALSCAVLLLLLVAVLSRGKRCSIARILRQYRAVIFHEIQNLVSGVGSAQGPSSLRWGMLLSWMWSRCGAWVGRGSVALPALLGRVVFKWGIPALRGRPRCFGVPELLLALFLQKNLSGLADRNVRAGPACRSDKVSATGPRAGV